MAKSLGNIYTVNDILSKGYSWRELRYVLLSAHYRRELNFTFKSLEDAKTTIQRIAEFLRRLKSIKRGRREGSFPILVRKFKREFLLSLNNDLNMPKALASLFNFINETNKLIDENKLTKKDGRRAINAILLADKILGLKLEEFLEEEQLPEEAEKLIREREEARRRRDFETADKIRKELKEKYRIILEDTPKGTKWRKL